jgi:hypothetical protein
MEMLLAPLDQTLEIARQALARRLRLWLQCPHLMQVALEEGGSADTLVLITPLGIEIHADDRERTSSEFGQGAEFCGNLHGSPFASRALRRRHLITRCAAGRMCPGKQPLTATSHVF